MSRSVEELYKDADGPEIEAEIRNLVVDALDRMIGQSRGVVSIAFKTGSDRTISELRRVLLPFVPSVRPELPEFPLTSLGRAIGILVRRMILAERFMRKFSDQPDPSAPNVVNVPDGPTTYADELDIIRACHGQLSKLGANGQQRVLDYLTSRMWYEEKLRLEHERSAGLERTIIGQPAPNPKLTPY
jgi:hypothetical protein